jgi:glycosyltransferase involved in cell wall biosynthesis
MKVAFISSLNGGVGTFTVGFVKELSKSVERIDLYLLSTYKKSIRVPELPENVKIITTQRSAISLLIELFFLINHLKKHDIIHLNYASFFLPVYITKKLWKVPFIYTSHNFPTPEDAILVNKLRHIFEAVCLKFASKNASAHITISDYAKRMLQERYKTSPIIINYGMDTEKFKFDEDKRKAIRKALNITETVFLILFVGVLYTHKNAITLVNAMPEILKNHPDAKLLIIGDGDQYNEIRNRVHELELEKSVIMKGFIEDVTPFYSAADLFVLPSTNEGFGLVFLEAMACGLPIAASNCSSCPEAVGDAGLLFDPKSSKDVAAKIIELMNNSELYETLKENGLERVREFTWARTAEQYYEVYKKALERNK